MGNANLDPNFTCQSLQVFLENVVTGTIAPTTVAEYEDSGSIGITFATVGIPPISKAITSEFAGVATGTQLNVAHIETQIVDTVRNDDPLGIAGEVVVVGLLFLLGVQVPITV